MHESAPRALADERAEADAALGELLAFVDDATAVLVVSDHGAKRMDGGICVNEWLRREGRRADARERQSRVIGGAELLDPRTIVEVQIVQVV